MALQDCINKFEKAGAPIRDDQVLSMERHIAAGMTDEQAVRAVHLAAHQNVVDIASRAVNEGGVLAPVGNALTDALTFQAKALDKLNDKKEALAAEFDQLNEEYGDINTVNSYFRTLQLPGKTGTQNNDLQNKHVLMDLMLHYSFIRPDIRKGAVVMGLKGKDHMALMDSFLKLQERREEIQDRFVKLDKEQSRLDEQVEVIWSGKKQTFYQSDITRMTVLHNLTEGSLIFAEDFGGLAVPSLAVLREGENLTGFGEISLIGTESLGDPSSVPIYDADGYTVRMPDPEYKAAKAADRDKLWGEVLPYVNQWEVRSNLGHALDESLRDRPNLRATFEAMFDSNAVKAQFLIEVKGENLTPVETDVKPNVKWALDPDLVAFMDKHGDVLSLNWEDPKRVQLLKDAADVFERVAVRSIMGRKNSRGPYSKEEAISIFRSGAYFNSDGTLSEMKYREILHDQRAAGTKELDTLSNINLLNARLDKGNNKTEFTAWIHARLEGMMPPPRIKISGKWEAYTLENVTRSMKGKLKGKEGFFGNSLTEGMMRALVAHRFKRMEEMRQRADNTILTDIDQLDDLRRAARGKMVTWLGEIGQFYDRRSSDGWYDPHRAEDDARRAIVKWATTTGQATVLDLEAFMTEAGFNDIPNWLMDEGMIAAMDWLAVPVPYFEAKPQRSVMLNEFAGAVIPSDAKPEVRALLAKQGIPYKEYQVGPNIDEVQNRRDAVTAFTEQLNKQGERTLFQSEIGFTSGLETAAQTMPFTKTMKGDVEVGTDAAQIIALLKKQPNVKQQELDSIDVEAWALAKGKITQDELVQFIQEGGVQIKETWYTGANDPPNASGWQQWDQTSVPDGFVDPNFEGDENGLRAYTPRILNDGGNLPSFTVIEDDEAGNVYVINDDTGEYLEVGGRVNEQHMGHAESAIDKVLRDEHFTQHTPEGVRAKDQAHWTMYTLPGGTNHREIVMHLPEIPGYKYSMDDISEGDASDIPNWDGLDNDGYWILDLSRPTGGVEQAFSPREPRIIKTIALKKSDHATLERAKQFVVANMAERAPHGANHSSHAYDESNIIVWNRITDRVGPNGEKIMFVEETQSDLHQAGLIDGYNYTQEQKEKSQMERWAVEMKAAKMMEKLDEPFLGFETVGEALRVFRRDLEDPPTSSVFVDPFAVLTKKQRALMNNAVAAYKKDELIQAGGPTPNLPFKGDAWAELGMKRMIRLAVEGGYDQIAWTTGSQQLDRYDISELFSKIEYDPRDETLTTYDEDGRVIETQHYTIEDLPGVIGAEPTLEIKNQITAAEKLYDIVEVSRGGLAGTINPGSLEDAFIGDIEKRWIKDGGGYVLVDQNGEILRTGDGSYHMAEYYDGAESIKEDMIYGGDLPNLDNVANVDVEDAGLGKRYDQLLVNVANRAIRSLDKGAKVKRMGIQMEGGGTVQGQRIERGAMPTAENPGGGGNLVPGTTDPGAFWVSGWSNDSEADKYDRKPISPRFDTYEEAEAWSDNITEGSGNFQHGFDITGDMMVNAMEGQPLFQGGGRASITFDSTNRAVIRMTQAKDLSSFLHEMGHFHVELMGDLAEMPDATPAVIDQYARMLKTMKVNSRREIGVEQHELYARSLEAYLREGKAPTAELQADMGTVKGWMLRVYTQIEQLLGPGEQLNDETRETFDRMLATDQQIKASEDFMGYVALYASADEMGVTQRAFDVYRAGMDEAHNEAVDHETAKMIKALHWGEQKWWRAELKKVAATVREEAELMDVYKALYLLQRGTQPDGSPIVQGAPFKLSKDDLIARYGKDFIKRLPRPFVYSAKGGMDADVAANLLGYPSGDKLIEALLRAPKMEDYIKVEADRRMKENHPDPMNDADAIDRATREVHNEKRARVLAAELSALRKQQREDAKIVAATKKDVAEGDRQARDANKGQLPDKVGLAHIKAAARDLIESKRIRDVNPNVYLQAERKAGRLAFEAMGHKKYAEAYAYKLKQIMNYEAYRAAIRAKAQSARDQKYLRTMETTNKRKRMGLGGVLDQIDAVLNGINFTNISMKQIDRDNAMKALKAAVESGAMVVTPATMAKIMDENVNWKELTFQELAGVRDVIKQLESQADHTQRIKVNGETVILEDAATEIAASINANHEQVAPIVGTKTGAERAKQGIDAIGASLANPGHIAKLLDGLDEYGTFNRLIVIPIRRAIAEKLMPMQAKALADVSEMFLKYYTRTEMQFFQRKNYAKLGDRKISKDEALSIALNQGSESNKDAFFGGKLIDGSVAYAPEDVAAVLALLDERDWLFVQATWDYNDSYWPAFAAAQKERRGIAAEKIEATPFTVTSSDGVEIKMRGGFYHLSYDSSQSDNVKAKEFNDYFNDMGNGVYVSSNTRAGASHNRVKNHGEVVHLGLHVIQSNLREVTREIAIGNEIDYVKSMLNNKEVRKAFKLTGNQHHLDALVLWVADVAVGELPAGHVIDKIAAVARTNFTMSRLLFNFRVGLLQFAGISQTAAIVGKRATAKGAIRYARNPIAITKLAFEKSAFLAGRYQQSSMAFDRDLADAANRAADSSHGLPTHTKHVTEIMQKYGFAPIYLAQGVTDVITWTAAYEKGLSTKGMSDSEAVIYADSQVQIAQTSGLWSDRSAFERGTTSATMRQNRWMRLWATLISFMVSRSVNVYIETKGAVRGGLNISNIVGYASNLTLLLVIDSILVSILYQKFDDDDELDDMAITVAKESVLGLIAGVPGVRDIEAAAYGSGNTAIGTVTNDIYHVAAKTSEGDFNRKFWRHTIDLFGILTGAPSSTANKMIDVAMSDDPELMEYLLGKDKDK